MKKAATVTVLVLTLLGTSQPATAGAVDAAAADFVQRQHVGENLISMALMTAQRTTTFGALVAKHGAGQAQELVLKELRSHKPKYQKQWDSILASSYSKEFTAAELTSLAADGARSAYAPKLKREQSLVGSHMRQAALPILSAYVTEALTSAMAKADSR